VVFAVVPHHGYSIEAEIDEAATCPRLCDRNFPVSAFERLIY